MGIERPHRQTTEPVESEQIFSLRCQQNRQWTEIRCKPWLRMTFHPLDTAFRKERHGGAGRDRTDDPLLAKQVLSQLSYGP